MKVSLILACAGKGERSGLKENKVLTEINGNSALSLSLNAFIKSGLIDQYIIVCSKNDFERVSSLYSNKCEIVIGGNNRTESVKNGLDNVRGDVVLIHDGARPFVTQKMIKDCVELCSKNGSALPVLPGRNTIVHVDDEVKYVGKQGLYSVQTPQGFNTAMIRSAYEKLSGEVYNDDGEMFQTCHGSLFTYEGDAKNVKLTYPEDFDLLRTVNEVRFGTGFDCHKLVENRKLILGGIDIPHSKGLLGHSDADVLTHAIMDAILSALSLRDIGYHFPDNDEKYKNADSIILLYNVLDMAKNKGYAVDSISAVIMAEKPKLLKHIPTITNKLATVLGISSDKVGIGATTLEGLGFVGREEGICVHATATLKTII